MADVRKRTATTSAMYHDVPTAAINQKQVPKPKRAVNQRALVLFEPIFFSISQVKETQTHARIIDASASSTVVPKTATAGIRSTAGIGG